MKLSALLLALFGSAAAAADPAVIAADAQLNQLIQQGAVDAAAAYYAPEFILTTGSGAPKDRARMLLEIGSPSLRLSRNVTEQVQVRVLGDTAVLTGVLHQIGAWQGQAFDVRLQVTDTWVRQGGRWLLLAGHAQPGEVMNAPPRLITLRPPQAEDRLAWERLARGYKAFYKTELPPASYEAAWQRLLDGSPAQGLLLQLNGAVVGLAHYLF